MNTLTRWSQIQERLAAQMDVLLSASILPSHLKTKPLKNPDDVEEETLGRCEAYLDSLTEKVQEWRRIRALVPESAWAMYDIQGIVGLREQKMIEAQAKLIRESWKNRPAILKGKSDVQKIRKRTKRNAAGSGSDSTSR